MKRILIVIMALLLLLGISACGTDTKETTVTDQKATDGAVQVDENLLTDDITVPASFFEGQDMSKFDTDSYVQENNFKKAVVNSDGSITVTMTKARHKEILKEMQTSAEESYQKLVDDKDSPYVEKITHDKGFKTVTVEVDRAGYDNSAFDITPFAVWFQAGFYQAFAGEELHCEVTMKYSDTGEVISTTVYPDVIQDEQAVAE